jgi:undecaprenyl-diphosphatase
LSTRTLTTKHPTLPCEFPSLRRPGATYAFDITRPASDGLARWLASRLRLQPLAVALAVGAAAFVSITVCFLIIGAAVTHTFETGALAPADDRAVTELAHMRSETGTKLSVVGSGLAETIPVIIAIVVGCTGLFVARRRWMALLIGIAFALEPSIYATVTYLVPRRRPPVTWLEPDLPPDASFPSGHVAAAMVLYGSAVLIAATIVRRRRVVIAGGIVGVMAVIAVAFSRVYRGEHHPTDVLAGALMGLACLVAAVFAVRSGVARSQIRHPEAAAVSQRGNSPGSARSSRCASGLPT